MTKKVVIIASGETERRALPILWYKLGVGQIDIKVRIPPNHRKLRAAVARQIIQAERFGSGGEPPHKYVILVDADGADPSDRIDVIRTQLFKNVQDEVRSRIKFAYAKWHLEAWYFGDAENLRAYLGNKALGNVDASHPDEIENPKGHLKNLLKRDQTVYTAQVSAEIAAQLDPQRIAGRSPSFVGLWRAVENGLSQ